MQDITKDTHKYFVRDKLLAPQSPPSKALSLYHWAMLRLFPNYISSFITIVSALFLGSILWNLIDFVLVRAIFTGDDGSVCRVASVGACWAYVKEYSSMFLYGHYPSHESWRPMLLLVLLIFILLPMIIPSFGWKLLNAATLFFALPIVGWVILRGGLFGLSVVEPDRWGGLLVTMVIATLGMFLAVPLGIALALGRRSSRFSVRWLSVSYIELWRGVPLITILFVSSLLFQLFLPEGISIDKIWRAAIGMSLFFAAYLAEDIRGGLNAIDKGQYEAAAVLGFGYWSSTLMVILPQALRHAIPAMVCTFISFFKDTTLVLIISIFDFLGMIQATRVDPLWASPSVTMTGYFLAAILYFAICCSMSYYSRFMESNLGLRRK